jgi:hypothetical protein
VVPGMPNVESISMHKDHNGMAKFQSVDNEDFKMYIIDCTKYDPGSSICSANPWTKLDPQNGAYD